MYPAERHAAIVAAAHEGTGRIAVVETSERLGVARETIRRDLAVLERQGVVRRHRGGAVLIDRVPFELSLQTRQSTEARERRAIAERIVGDLPEEGSILLDSGSMTLEIAMLLPENRTLLVVTNSLPVAALLAGRERLTVLTIPGQARAVTQATVGDWAGRRLAQLHVDVAVVGANGVHLEAGVTTTLPEEAEVKRGMLRAARRRVLAVTASKFGAISFCHAADIAEFDVIVTDDRLDAATVAAASILGPEVHVVTPGEAPRNLVQPPP
ncbi:DeoR/GlpR family DNA-binding transcription regulator [Mycetocola miduiensis]|uniref:Lactose phosphotransferase system repressor n=1 Tax=Mycetocola miduiensis TaxID=995034 RepID=A0A1I4YE11_9MICO|nr:DeoR/GlpR family DNA-binding transcription regulator [Mycetocola miduiensis]SFN36264.1 transcriptional regulator, DeoR family [Mycetocola miduiensis]